LRSNLRISLSIAVMAALRVSGVVVNQRFVPTERASLSMST
jgi:hypothetical protein